MAGIDAQAFRSRLREFSRSDLADFVAALWEARGREVDREDDLLVVTAPDTGERTVVLPVPARRSDRWLAPREPRREEVDAVVLGGARPPTWATDREVVDGENLREQLLYAVDGESRRELITTHFGVDPSELAGDSAATEPSTGRLPGFPLTTAATGRRAVVAGVAVLVVVGLLVTALGVGPLDSASLDAPAGDGPDTAGSTPSPTSTPAAVSYPPGLSASGVEDPEALAAAHVTNMSGFTYTMEFRYREVGPNHTGTIRETTEVVADTRYARRVNRTGSFVTDPAAVTDPAVVRRAETFANGEMHFERIRTDGSVRYTRRHVYAGRFPIHDARAAGFVQRTLSAQQTAVTGTFERDGRTFYRVRFSGDDRPAFRDVRGQALVDERGVVHLIRVRYRPADHPSITVTVTMQYTDVRSTELTEPDWLSDATNETDEEAGWIGSR